MASAVTFTTVRVPMMRRLWIRLRWGMHLRMSLILGCLPGLFQRSARLRQTYKQKYALMHQGGLSKELVDDWMSDNVSRVTPSIERKSKKTLITDALIEGREVANTPHKRAAVIAYSLISKNQGQVHDFIHIGARVDTINAFLAKKFPQTEFHSIDMQPNLAEVNSLLPVSPNWKLHPGYALHVMAEPEFRADVVLMVSTAVKFNNKEIREYGSIFAEKTKFLIFHEPWWTTPFSFGEPVLMVPEKLDPNFSPVGGFPGDYHHNYFAVLKDYGFEILRAEIAPSTDAVDSDDIIVVAVNRRLAPGPVEI